MSAFGIGVPELIIIFVLALVVFGPGKLPEIGSGIGRAMREFRKATSDITSEFTREMGTADTGQQTSKQESKAEDKTEDKTEGDQNKAT